MKTYDRDCIVKNENARHTKSPWHAGIPIKSPDVKFGLPKFHVFLSDRKQNKHRKYIRRYYN